MPAKKTNSLELRDRRITFVVTKREFFIYSREAEVRGISVSDFIRKMIKKGMENG